MLGVWLLMSWKVILGGVLYVLGLYLILIGLGLSPGQFVIDFLKVNPLFDNRLLLFILGVVSGYLGYTLSKS